MTPKPTTQELSPVRYDVSLLTSEDFYLFNEGSHYRIYEKMGAHVVNRRGPRARSSGCGLRMRGGCRSSGTSMAGTRNRINCSRAARRDLGGLIPGVAKGRYTSSTSTPRNSGTRSRRRTRWDFSRRSRRARLRWCGSRLLMERRGLLKKRADTNSLHAPMSIYEVHLGSWMRVPEEGNRSLTYREIAPRLADYVNKLGFTHVELLPIMEHPFYGSWDIRRRDIFLRHRVTARRRISCTLWITCTSTESR